MFRLFQYVTEKMGGAEGTKLDLDFVEMERVSILFVLHGKLTTESIIAMKVTVCTVLNQIGNK